MLSRPSGNVQYREEFDVSADGIGHNLLAECLIAKDQEFQRPLDCGSLLPLWSGSPLPNHPA
jgi:hypothetical protein